MDFWAQSIHEYEHELDKRRTQLFQKLDGTKIAWEDVDDFWRFVTDLHWTDLDPQDFLLLEQLRLENVNGFKQFFEQSFQISTAAELNHTFSEYKLGRQYDSISEAHEILPYLSKDLLTTKSPPLQLTCLLQFPSKLSIPNHLTDTNSQQTLSSFEDGLLLNESEKGVSEFTGSKEEEGGDRRGKGRVRLRGGKIGGTFKMPPPSPPSMQVSRSTPHSPSPHSPSPHSLDQQEIQGIPPALQATSPLCSHSSPSPSSSFLQRKGKETAIFGHETALLLPSSDSPSPHSLRGLGHLLHLSLPPTPTPTPPIHPQDERGGSNKRMREGGEGGEEGACPLKLFLSRRPSPPPLPPDITSPSSLSSSVDRHQIRRNILQREGPLSSPTAPLSSNSKKEKETPPSLPPEWDDSLISLLSSLLPSYIRTVLHQVLTHAKKSNQRRENPPFSPSFFASFPSPPLSSLLQECTILSHLLREVNAHLFLPLPLPVQPTELLSNIRRRLKFCTQQESGVLSYPIQPTEGEGGSEEWRVAMEEQCRGSQQEASLLSKFPPSSPSHVLRVRGGPLKALALELRRREGARLFQRQQAKMILSYRLAPCFPDTTEREREVEGLLRRLTTRSHTPPTPSPPQSPSISCPSTSSLDEGENTVLEGEGEGEGEGEIGGKLKDLEKGDYYEKRGSGGNKMEKRGGKKREQEKSVGGRGGQKGRGEITELRVKRSSSSMRGGANRLGLDFENKLEVKGEEGIGESEEEGEGKDEDMSTTDLGDFLLPSPPVPVHIIHPASWGCTLRAPLPLTSPLPGTDWQTVISTCGQGLPPSLPPLFEALHPACTSSTTDLPPQPIHTPSPPSSSPFQATKSFKKGDNYHALRRKGEGEGNTIPPTELKDSLSELEAMLSMELAAIESCNFLRLLRLQQTASLQSGIRAPGGSREGPMSPRLPLSGIIPHGVKKMRELKEQLSSTLSSLYSHTIGGPHPFLYENQLTGINYQMKHLDGAPQGTLTLLGAAFPSHVPFGPFISQLKVGDSVEVLLKDRPRQNERGEVTSPDQWVLGEVAQMVWDQSANSSPQNLSLSSTQHGMDSCIPVLRHIQVRFQHSFDADRMWICVEDGLLAPPATHLLPTSHIQKLSSRQQPTTSPSVLLSNQSPQVRDGEQLLGTFTFSPSLTGPNLQATFTANTSHPPSPLTFSVEEN